MKCEVCGSRIRKPHNVKYCSRNCFLRRGEVGIDEIYKFIVNYKRLNDGNSPTVRHIMKELNYSSTSLVFNRLKILESDGKIRISDNKSRNIEIVGGEYLPPKKR